MVGAASASTKFVLCMLLSISLSFLLINSAHASSGNLRTSGKAVNAAKVLAPAEEVEEEVEGPNTRCLSDCNNHGKCNLDGDTWACHCDFGYLGASCGKKLCSAFDCHGHGVCNPAVNPPYADTATKEKVEGLIEEAKDYESGTIVKINKVNRRLIAAEIEQSAFRLCTCQDGFTGLTCDQVACPKQCVNGDCFDGGCVCDKGWTGQTCEVSICENKGGEPCHGNGNCEGGVCMCNAGFTGLKCETGPGNCPAENGKICAGNGICVGGKCMCAGLYLSPSCRYRGCKDDCHQENGICNDGTCECKPGFSGDTCERRDSLCTGSDGSNSEDGQGSAVKECPKCGSHGKCGEDKVCVCDEGYMGETCNMHKCPGACSDRGKCGEDKKCTCNPGWKGEACDVPTCKDEACGGHGECREGHCQCDYLYGGEACEFKMCPGIGEQCSGNGKCVDGTCVCDTTWYGQACNQRSCPKDASGEECSGRGLCVDNGEGPVCECIGHHPAPFDKQKLYSGDACNVVECPDPLCSGKGQCKQGKCECNAGFKGDACQVVDIENTPAEKTCGVGKSVEEVGTNGCGGPEYGKCHAGKCFCRGRVGVHCEKMPASCPNECAGHGVCHTSGNCQCDVGWSGVDCSTGGCPRDCAGHGRCIMVKENEPVCFCEEGYSGDDCATKAGESVEAGTEAPFAGVEDATEVDSALQEGPMSARR